jgi:hypothetical protein
MGREDEEGNEEKELARQTRRKHRESTGRAQGEHRESIGRAQGEHKERESRNLCLLTHPSRRP